MIKSIWIDNFKSLVDFKLELSHFTCLVGLNGAGKSTVLQSMDFIAQLMSGDLHGWLKERQWNKSDINSKLTKASNINFKVEVSIAENKVIIWKGSVNRSHLRCTTETVELDGKRILTIEDGEYAFVDETGKFGRGSIVFDYQGSIMSILKDSQMSEELRELKHFILKTQSLDLLSPDFLRAQTRDAVLGLGGQNLSAFIHKSGADGKEKLQKSLLNAYKQLEKIDTRAMKFGWKRLSVTERFGNILLKTEARHMNDGMLRLMAIFSQLHKGGQFLLFDEIENGINPELVEFLVDSLVDAESQILVTTHSPMILNFLEEDVARSGVIYLYKNGSGHTQATRLFDIPSLNEKIGFMGPGEAFIDTDLTRLQDEIAANSAGV